MSVRVQTTACHAAPPRLVRMCVYVFARALAGGTGSGGVAGWEFSAPRCYVTGPGFPLFPSRSAMVRSRTVGFRSFQLDA